MRVPFYYLGPRSIGKTLLMAKLEQIRLQWFAVITGVVSR